jgi:hypothetical protein
MWCAVFPRAAPRAPGHLFLFVCLLGELPPASLAANAYASTCNCLARSMSRVCVSVCVPWIVEGVRTTRDRIDSDQIIYVLFGDQTSLSSVHTELHLIRFTTHLHQKHSQDHTEIYKELHVKGKGTNLQRVWNATKTAFIYDHTRQEMGDATE